MGKLKVMLVDDNAQFLKAARNTLAAQSCVASVECASSGIDALMRLEEFKPDVVLTDIMMPDMSGFVLMRKLRERDAPPRMIAVTLHEGPEYRAAARHSGAEDMICKREFSKVIEKLIAGMASEK